MSASPPRSLRSKFFENRRGIRCGGGGGWGLGRTIGPSPRSGQRGQKLDPRTAAIRFSSDNDYIAAQWGGTADDDPIRRFR